MSEKRYVGLAEFARLIGVNKNGSQYVRQLVVRGHIVREKDGTIDTHKGKNSAYLLSRKNKIVSEPEKSVNVKDPEPSGLKLEFNADGSIDVTKLVAYTLNDLKTIEDIRLKQANVRLKELEESKLRGKFMDADDAANALLLFAQTFMRSISDSMNAWVLDVVHRNKLPKAELAKLTGEYRSLINNSYDEAIASAEEKMEQSKSKTSINEHIQQTETDED